MWHAHLARDSRARRPCHFFKRESGDAVSRVAAGSKRGAEETYCRVPALVELLTSRLNVAPLSKCRLPVLRLSVEPPSAEALVDCVICKPLSGPVRLAAVLVVAPTVLPTALVVVPATLPTVEVVVLTAPPTVFPTPPSNPPLVEDRVVVLVLDDAIV